MIGATLNAPLWLIIADTNDGHVFNNQIAADDRIRSAVNAFVYPDF